MRAAAVVVLLVLGAAQGRAANLELRVSAVPEFNILRRSGRTNGGVGLTAGVDYGVSDWLSWRVAVGCNRFSNLRNDGAEYQDATTAAVLPASVFYDSFRCSSTTGPVLTFGARWVVQAGLLTGYRSDSRTDRQLATSGDDVLRAELEDKRRHQWVVMPTLGLDYRLGEMLAVGAFARLLVTMNGGQTELDLSLGVGASLYGYP